MDENRAIKLEVTIVHFEIPNPVSYQDDSARYTFLSIHTQEFGGLNLTKKKDLELPILEFRLKMARSWTKSWIGKTMSEHILLMPQYFD